MKLPLDTHAVFWFCLDDPQRSAGTKAVIMDPANEKWLSPARFREVAIKISIGRMSW